MKISICFLQACFMDTNRFIKELINNSITFEMYGKLLVFSFSFWYGLCFYEDESLIFNVFKMKNYTCFYC